MRARRPSVRCHAITTRSVVDVIYADVLGEKASRRRGQRPGYHAWLSICDARTCDAQRAPRRSFVPHAQAPAPQRIYGQRLELVEGTSPRELPCHCSDKPVKPSKARRDYLPSVSQRRHCHSLSSAPSRSGVCAGAAQLLFVVKARLCSFADHLQVLSPTTRLYSRHQLTFVLRGGIAAIPPSLYSPLICFCYCR